MTTTEIRPVPPYSLDRTVGAFARFPEERVDCLSGSKYRRAFQDQRGIVLLEVRDDTGPGKTTLTVESLVQKGQPDESAQRATVARLLASNEDVQPVYELMNSHATLGWLADQLRGLRRTIDPTPFEGLVSSILAQLISIRGAAVIRSRVVEAFGASIDWDDERYWSFPHPEQVAEASVDQLCSLGMTQVKAKAILTVASMAIAGELELDDLARQTDRDVMTHLTSIPGVGPWTAEWFLVNVMGRMSIVPAGDLGIRRSTGHWLCEGEMPSSAEVREIYAPFGELQAYVAYYVLSAERYNLKPR